MYKVQCYYDYNLRGLECEEEFDSRDDAKYYAWECMGDGGFVRITNTENGKSVVISSDDISADDDASEQLNDYMTLVEAISRSHRSRILEGICSRVLDEDFSVWGRGSFDEDDMWDEIERKKGLTKNGFVYLVAGDTYSIKDQLKSQGASYDTGAGWYFLDGDHGYECEQIPAQDAIVIVDVGNSSGYGTHPEARFSSLVASIRNKMTDEFKEKKRKAAMDAYQNGSGPNPSGLGAVGDRVEFEAVAEYDGSDQVGGIGWESDYDTYKLTTPNGDIIKADIYGFKKQGQMKKLAGQQHKWGGIITRVWQSRGETVTKVKNLTLKD